MTDRTSSLLVVLEADVRIDAPALEEIINAIGLLKGVVSVKPNVGSSVQQEIADERARYDLGNKIIKMLYPDKE